MATIEISTTQNVTIDYELATLRERFFSFIIDLLVFYVIYAFFTIILSVFLGDAINHWGGRFIGLMNIVGLLLYHFLLEVFNKGQSVGKRVMHLKVVRPDGREPSLGDFLLRSVFLLVDFFFSLGVLAAVLIGSTFKSQRLGDLAANTAVIKVKNQVHFLLSDILKIQSLHEYEPQYPEVRQLKEADLLLIKNLLARHQAWRNDAHHYAVEEAVKTICGQLGLDEPPTAQRFDFLKTLIRDYIVLTR